MKKRIGKGLLIALVIFIILSIFENMKPLGLKDDSFYYINPVIGTEYVSELHKLKKQTVCTYTFLNSESSEDGKDEFTITIAKLEGILNNRYNIYMFLPYADSALTNPTYDDISELPQYEIKRGNNYYGSVYIGVIPSDCKRLTIDGVEAELKHYTFNLNGEDVDFIFYSCFIEQDEYKENVKIEYEQQ